MSNSGSLQFCQPQSTGTITSKRLTPYLYLNGVCVCLCVCVCGGQVGFSELLNGHELAASKRLKEGERKGKLRVTQLPVTLFLFSSDES